MTTYVLPVRICCEKLLNWPLIMCGALPRGSSLCASLGFWDFPPKGSWTTAAIISTANAPEWFLSLGEMEELDITMTFFVSLYALSLSWPMLQDSFGFSEQCLGIADLLFRECFHECFEKSLRTCMRNKLRSVRVSMLYGKGRLDFHNLGH